MFRSGSAVLRRKVLPSGRSLWSPSTLPALFRHQGTLSEAARPEATPIGSNRPTNPSKVASLDRENGSPSTSGVPESRQPTPRSKPLAGHLPNKPNSGFLSDVDDCFFDGMKVWKDQSGNELKGIPTFRLMDGTGKLVNKESEQLIQDSLSDAEAVKIYTYMSLLPQLDQVLYSAQRQGRISFWMTSYGEEAAVIGTASALAYDDEIYAQYRELGLLLYRGLSVDKLLSQIFGNDNDQCKGRQMPTHIGSPDHHFVTISSPLATQIPQAAGSAFALKRTQDRKHNIVGCWFGEGAASEGDFHAGLNFAATLNCPVLWLVRNNGFAISTSSEEQYRGDGIAARGPGYGTLTIRVDGNDVLAVRIAIQEAKRRAVQGSRPVLIEMMTYRVGHHSTSDDSGIYRPKSSVEEWTAMDNPLHRFRAYLESRKLWSKDQEDHLVSTHRSKILQALQAAEQQPLPPLETLFADTYAQAPPILQEQRKDLKRLIEKYGKDYEPWRKALKKVKGNGQDL
ncbi:unnamed protein product [Sympodiomycopsis kandeliae]